MSPKDILKVFIKSDLKLYEDCEIIIQACLSASVKCSVESLVESMISVYENHFDQSRNLDEISASEEFIIAFNGPNLSHCDSVVGAAMNKYWQKGKRSSKWHFIKQHAMEKYVNKSQVLERLKLPSKLPFMVEAHFLVFTRQ